MVSVLEQEPKDGLAAALARLGWAFMARDSASFTRLHGMQRNSPQDQFLRYRID